MSNPDSSSDSKPFWLKENTGSALPQSQTATPSSSLPTPKIIIEGSDGSTLSPETIEKIQRQPGFAAYIDKMQKLAAEKNKNDQGISAQGAYKSQPLEWVIPEAQEAGRNWSGGHSETEIPGDNGTTSSGEPVDAWKDGIGTGSETMGVAKGGDISVKEPTEVAKEEKLDASDDGQVIGGA